LVLAAACGLAALADMVRALLQPEAKTVAENAAMPFSNWRRVGREGGEIVSIALVEAMVSLHTISSTNQLLLNTSWYPLTPLSCNHLW